jgi:hypothetical protein
MYRFSRRATLFTATALCLLSLTAGCTKKDEEATATPGAKSGPAQGAPTVTPEVQSQINAAQQADAARRAASMPKPK